MSGPQQPTNERRVDQLLDEAESRLVRGGRPSQVVVRRAVSDAYYALFHFLIDRCTTQMLGTASSASAARDAAARGFRHGTLKNACNAFRSGGTLPKSVASVEIDVPEPVRTFASTFVETQKARHNADYSWNASVSKSVAERRLAEARSAIEDFRALDRSDPGVKWFLAMATVRGGLP